MNFYYIIWGWIIAGELYFAGEAIGKIVYVLLKNFQNTTSGFLVEKKILVRRNDYTKREDIVL